MYFKEKSLLLAYGLNKIFGILDCKPVGCEANIYEEGGLHPQMQKASLYMYLHKGLIFLTFFYDIYCELCIPALLLALLQKSVNGSHF